LEQAVAQGVQAVEARLLEAVESSDPLVSRSSRHLLEAGGKRLRPLLTVLASQLGSGAGPRVVDAGAVVELTHLASLYHDDVMDSAPLRRGQAAAHQVYGNTVAILTGDMLFAKASGIVADLGPESVRIQAQTFERLCLGQIHETVGPAEGEDPVAHHLSVLADKTGSLIATSARLGALLAGCSAEVIDALISYGEAVGVAFQLADDIIDLTQDPAVTGKNSGTDLREGVPTMPVLLVKEQAARDRAEGLGQTDAVTLADALDGDLTSDQALEAVVTRLRESDAVDRAQEIAREWANRAVGHLAPLPDGPVKDALASIADLFVRRLA
jgi:heptaprenyl diphosphate synthase